jgi:hypothetical protein
VSALLSGSPCDAPAATPKGSGNAAPDRSCRAPVPTAAFVSPLSGAFVSIRLDASRQRIAELLNKDATAAFDEVAAKILRQLGYPTSRPWVHKFFPHGITLGGQVIVAPVSFPIQVSRVTRAMELFFEVAAEECLRREKSGIPRAEAAPVLLWDEVRVGGDGSSSFASCEGCATKQRRAGKRILRPRIPSLATASTAGARPHQGLAICKGGRC